jgi:hypothetical protein
VLLVLEEFRLLKLEKRVLMELESYAEIDAIKITPLNKKHMRRHP